MSSSPGEITQTCGLVKIPPEILDRITRHLTTTEYCKLRLTSKAVEHALFSKFASEFFTRKQFMVSEFSLKALRDISKSRLAGCLRQVHLGLDEVEPLVLYASTGVAAMESLRLLQLRLAEQETLWTLGLVPKYLAEAFARLPNLETCVVRDFNSNRRSRDGCYRHWLSYGTNTLQMETGMRPRPRHGPGWKDIGLSENATRMFKAVVHALAMAQARPTAIEMMERRGHFLFDAAFYIHPDFEAAVAPVLGRLKRLHICLDMAWDPCSKTSQTSQAWHHVNAAKFLRLCKDLEELRINGKRDYIANGGRNALHHLFDWLATKPQTEALPPPVADGEEEEEEEEEEYSLPIPPYAELARLKTLSLGMTATTVEDLVRVIARFADTLENLELWRIHLSFEDKANDEALAENGPTLYTVLLRKMLEMPNLNLRHIKLGNLHQTLRPIGKEAVAGAVDFKPEASTRDREVMKGEVSTTTALEYTGSDWRHFVSHEMIPRLYTPRAILNQESDMEVDEDENEGEGDAHNYWSSMI
ncbi:hypothetical protein MKX07_001321 [Trichoderma sp. CBMAI-0711]|nr:hypothetical protein MKX07_001321 [Trichoderma sp. CBMAI-0711]